MSTKAKLIVLNDDMCQVAHVSYGGDFASHIVYGGMPKGEIDDIIQYNINNDLLYETTDKEEVKRLNQYDSQLIIDMFEVDLCIFVKRIDEELVDVVIRSVCYLDEYKDPEHYFSD